ncbi:alpha-protein kinase 1 [Bombina bombina]|uniref:alpha-protein kinase 1 n=1 Tax=Bombina bombina TaxID=8345 RepID=UPI00235A7647|nr:alpha-protein kinase 1 [Bombina bombina]XP_053559531.1 alpha-protein kinase 1 [Bombina bombina]XP_053559532.1 alpha-protein kinase 1 [Bombina bombina]XP_053559533.1 alpha-protein kinase 1 [Bombina bombina]
MNSQEIVALLQECKRMLDALASGVSELSEEEKNSHQQCEALLPDDLRTLIQEAKEMKWPFVPERWQYKQAVGPEDKTNLQDLINPRLHDLLVFLKASIALEDSITAAAIVFLIDRFLYWADASTRLLQVAKGLHKMWPATPIAPQVVIRQARISVNSGKLLKAEYILSSLINNNGATGSWLYSNENDRVLVQSVCIQIRGQILQKLGMWYEAAELIWASVVGFFELPIPDKKGIGTSLGILADIFISMSEEDYQRFKKNSHVCLSLLEEFDHRLLLAAEVCKLAATFSLYTPLFVLTNMNICGTCLLSYSFSYECPLEKRSHYLSEAKESFEIGLLTKKKGDSVTSKQELHSFVKSAFCLANVHKWLQSENVPHDDVNRLCREATEKLTKYTWLEDKQDKANLASEIITLISCIKDHLKVKPFAVSDEGSYVPDNYRNIVEKNIFKGEVSFKKLLEMYAQHHNAVCKLFENTCRNHKALQPDLVQGVCVTAMKTRDTTIDDTAVDTSRDSSSLEQKSSRRRNKLVRSNAMNMSLDVGKQKILSRSISSNSPSSMTSWSKLSKSSSSWESVSFNDRVELPEEGNVAISNLDNVCSTAASDGTEESAAEEIHSPSSIDFEKVQLEDGQDPCCSTDIETNAVISRDANNKHSDIVNKSVGDSNLTSTVSSAIEPHAAAVQTVDLFAETESATDGLPYEDTSKVPPGPSKIQNIVSHRNSCSSSEGRSFEEVDRIEQHFLSHQWSVDSSSSKQSRQQPASRTGEHLPSYNANVKVQPECNTCESTEEEVDKLSLILSSSHGSSSWGRSAQFSRSLSESNSFLNSSGSSFEFLHLRNDEKMHQAPTLDAGEYEKLLSGVEHEWLRKKLQDTVLPRFPQFHKAYNALHLKFSKKSELWKAQETYVYFGDYVTVTKKGKQRKAFWIHFLHQDETLGRYVGKEYREDKSIFYHFNDVERQMTAQYYVTEFNKRLYELNIPTQIFYIPSSAILILEERNIIGCISVEPYILGDFVKLSNNKDIVKAEYEATKYGLALGHFTYEFSKCSDIVVDLQGWVTDGKKGEALIYLTDPQIHSVKTAQSKRENGKPTCINFGKKGINYFFSRQHQECNEICHRLGLTRPNLESL